MYELKEIDAPISYQLPDNIDTNSVIVLPERLNQDGVALYVQSSMELYKELRGHDDLQVGYLETKGGRKWIDRLGNGDELIISLILSIPAGVISSAIWYAIQRFAIERKDSQNTRLKVAIASRAPDSTVKWYEFDGSPEDVKELADRIIDEQEKKKPEDK